MNGSQTHAGDHPSDASHLAARGEAPPAESPIRRPTFTRVDAPHAAATRRAADGLKLLELADSDESSAPPFSVDEEQLREQGQELAGILRQRQRELDRRESQLAALAARLEGEERSWRLSLTENERALTERSRECDEQASAIERRAAALAHAESEIETIRADLDSLRQALDLREAAASAAERRLDERRAEHQRELAAWRERVSGAAVEEQSLRARLVESEALLDGQLRDLDRERDLFAADTARREAALEAEAQSLAEERRCLLDRQRRRDAALDERERRLVRREQALDGVASQVEEAHRQALLSRLVVEQVWGQLRLDAAPGELSLAAAEAERRLAEQSLLSDDSLAERQGRLRELAATLRGRFDALNAKRIRWQQTRAAQHRAIERRLADFAQREQAIDELAASFAAKEAAWLAERRQLVGRLRQLLDTTAHTSPSAD